VLDLETLIIPISGHCIPRRSQIAGAMLVAGRPRQSLPVTPRLLFSFNVILKGGAGGGFAHPKKITRSK
jgi:hypothetical protein